MVMKTMKKKLNRKKIILFLDIHKWRSNGVDDDDGFEFEYLKKIGTKGDNNNNNNKKPASNRKLFQFYHQNDDDYKKK